MSPIETELPFVDINPQHCKWPLLPDIVIKSSSSIVIGLFLYRSHLVIAKMNGDILVVDDKLQTPVRNVAKVYLGRCGSLLNSLPSDKTLEYAELDPVTGCMFFTMASDDGILFGRIFSVNELQFAATGQHSNVSLEFFVKNDSDREFWGMAVDAGRRLLYCCNRRGKSNIGAWRLSDGQQLLNYGVTDSWPYSFLQCCTILGSNNNCRLKSATGQGGSSFAVSSSPSQRILLFDNDDDGRQCRFVTTIVGKKIKRNNDPLKFVVNPLGMAFDSYGNLLVADCGSLRLQIFSPSVEGELQSLSGEWLSDKLASSPRCVAIAGSDDGVSSPLIFAGLHNGDVVCFKKEQLL